MSQQTTDCKPNPFVVASLGNSEELKNYIEERVNETTGTTKEQREERKRILMENFKHKLVTEGMKQ